MRRRILRPDRNHTSHSTIKQNSTCIRKAAPEASPESWPGKLARKAGPKADREADPEAVPKQILKQARSRSRSRPGSRSQNRPGKLVRKASRNPIPDRTAGMQPASPETSTRPAAVPPIPPSGRATEQLSSRTTEQLNSRTAETCRVAPANGPQPYARLEKKHPPQDSGYNKVSNYLVPYRFFM